MKSLKDVNQKEKAFLDGAAGADHDRELGLFLSDYVMAKDKKKEMVKQTVRLEKDFYNRIMKICESMNLSFQEFVVNLLNFYEAFHLKKGEKE